MANVVFDNITKMYSGGVTAIKNASFMIQDKQFAVLVGPSGSGKSTILKMIAGLEDITQGKLYIDNVFMNNVEPKDRDIAMVFQNYALYPHMTVYKNMAFGLKLRKYSREDISKRIAEAAEILRISHLMNRKPKDLSGGERQRVALGRAIVRHPKVFLFDEPLSNLDAKLRMHMRIELKKLHRDLQSTMIYVTHDQTEAMTMGDIIIVLNDGLIQQIANPIDIYQKPSNQFVAGFIGNPPMNFLAGNLVRKDGKLLFQFGSLSLGIDDSMVVSLDQLQRNRIILGIRPEDIYLGWDSLPKRLSADLIGAQITAFEPSGNETLLYLKIDKYQVAVRINSLAIFSVGNNVSVALDMKNVHFFEDGTGMTII